MIESEGVMDNQPTEKRINVIVDVSDQTMNYGEGWEENADAGASIDKYLSFVMRHISAEFPDYAVSVRGKDFTGLNAMGEIEIVDDRDPLADEVFIENDKTLIEELIGEAYDNERWLVTR